MSNMLDANQSRSQSVNNQTKDDTSKQEENNYSSNKEKWMEQAEQELLESPTWKHRK